MGVALIYVDDGFEKFVLSHCVNDTSKENKRCPHLYPSPSITIVGEVITVGKAYNQQITEGDRDICFYNEKCYRPVDLMDMPTNAGRSSKEVCQQSL